jgi:hypothetical protein
VIVRAVIHVLPPIEVPLWDPYPSRVRDRLLDLADIVFSQKTNTHVGVNVERLNYHLSKIIAYTFNFTKSNYQFLAAFNVLSGDSEDMFILGYRQAKITKQYSAIKTMLDATGQKNFVIFTMLPFACAFRSSISNSQAFFWSRFWIIGVL